MIFNKKTNSTLLHFINIKALQKIDEETRQVYFKCSMYKNYSSMGPITFFIQPVVC